MVEHCPVSCHPNCASELHAIRVKRAHEMEEQRQAMEDEKRAAKAAADAAARRIALQQEETTAFNRPARGNAREDLDNSRRAPSRAPNIAKQEEMELVWPPPAPPGELTAKQRIAIYGDVDSLDPTIAAMARRNTEQPIMNSEAFGPLDWTDPSLVVIVIMSHNRAANLGVLFDSLRKTRGIAKALVVISQDFSSPELNAVIDKVDFCMLLRIFLPASTQLHPSEFPGTDPRDCTVKHANGQWYSPREAKAAGCLNADFPDKYGHYREAGYTAIKHHWWWKIAFVFDHVHVLKNHPGPKIFVEEDNYLSPDVLTVSQQLAAALATSATNDGLFSLGTYDTPQVGTEMVARSIPWDPTKHNQGMGFNRTFWERLKGCREMFCDYDDYNWDWTLLRLSASNCFDKKAASSLWSRGSLGSVSGLRTLLLSYPRSFHTGECGVHFKSKKDCDPSGVVRKIEGQLAASASSLFPQTLRVDTTDDRRSGKNAIAPNGGWGDKRDRELCMDMSAGGT